LIKEGTILGKWHYHDIPDPEVFSGDLLSHQLTVLQKNSNTWLGLLLILGLLLFAATARLILPAERLYDR